MKFLDGFYNNPLFITGQSRTGSTALKLALAAHPQVIARSGEAPLIANFSSLTYLWSEHPLADYFQHDLRIPPAQLEYQLRKLIIDFTVGKHTGAYFLFKMLLRRKLLTKKTVWCAKSYPDVQEYQGIVKLFPQAKFVLLIRNPVDQISSTLAIWPGKPFEECCMEWRDQFDKYHYAWNNPRFIIVRHEDLVDNPNPILESIFKLCGIPSHPLPSQYLNSKTVNTTKITNDPTIKSYLKNNHQTSNWSESQKSLLLNLCGAKMKELNYEVNF